MLSRILRTAAFFILITASGVFSQEYPPLRLNDLILEALQNNPELRAARHQAAAARTQIRQARAWHPPEIGVELFQTPIQSFPNPVKDCMEIDYFVQQTLFFPGKLSAMTRSAKSNAAMMEQGYLAVEQKTIRELKNAYYNLYFVQHKIQINAENQDLMREFSDIAKRRYEVGVGKQADILRAQTELFTLINDGINLQQEKKTAEAMLNALLSRPMDEPLGFVPDIIEIRPIFTFQQLKTLAQASRPELRAMTENVEMNTAKLSLAKREYFPDIMFRVMYKDMANTSDDFWAAMAGMSIPLAFWSGGKFKGKIEESELNILKAEEDYHTVENMVFFQVQDALAKVEMNRNLMLLYKQTLISQAEQTLQSTEAAYQTGNAEFVSLIDAYRVMLMVRLNYHMSVMNYMASQAALEQAVGLNLEEITDRLK